MNDKPDDRGERGAKPQPDDRGRYQIGGAQRNDLRASCAASGSRCGDWPADQCDERPGEPVSGWISAAIMPLEPGPNRTSTNWPGRSSVTRSGAGFPYARKYPGSLAAGQEAEAAQPVEPLDLRPLQPAGRGDADMGARRQHLPGWIAVDSSIEMMRKA